MAVHQREDRDLLSAEFLFDHDLLAGVAKGPVDHDLPDGVGGLLRIVGDDDALALGQTGRFDDHRRLVGLHVGQGLGGVLEDARLGRGDRGAAHQLLGPALIAFDLGRGLVGSEDLQSPLGQLVGQPPGQGVFRTDHHQFHRVVSAEEGDLIHHLGINLRDVDGDIRADLCRARIARCEIDLPAPGGLLDLPPQRVLAPAAADD